MIFMFRGREYELNVLQNLYDSDVFQFIPIYGRRRVGKTSLIKKFIEGKKSIYFSAVTGTDEINLTLLNELVTGEIKYQRFDRILEKIEEISNGRRLILVIDEFPNLISDAKHNMGLLNNFIESVKETSKLFIILCGSSLSIMENDVLGKKSPLYGRRTGQMEIEPFDFSSSASFLEGFTEEEKIAIYGLVGGIPYYLEQFDGNLSFKENIITKYIDPVSVLGKEADLMFIEDFRKPADYYSIIHSMAKGNMQISDISNDTGIDRTSVSHYLDNLILLKMVRKETPFGTRNSKKTRYVVSDLLLRSHFKFIYPRFVDISGKDLDTAYSYLEDHLSEYLGHVFEEICEQYLRRNGYWETGKWWGKIKSIEEEIDIIAANDTAIVFVECKYRNELSDANVIDTLIDRSSAIKDEGRERRYAVFSKSGYTDVAKNKAKKNNVMLYGLDDLF